MIKEFMNDSNMRVKIERVIQIRLEFEDKAKNVTIVTFEIDNKRSFAAFVNQYQSADQAYATFLIVTNVFFAAHIYSLFSS